MSEVALKKAKEFGANITINLNKKQIKYLDGIKINKSVVTTGNIKAIETSMKLLSYPGICYLMGVPPKKSKIKINAWNLMHDQTLKGSLGGNARPQIDIPKFINLDKRK